MSESRYRGNSGFTIIEMLVAVAVLLAVVVSVFSLLDPAQGVFQTQPQVSDLQQRLRVGLDTLAKDLLMAGAGVATGTSAGSLSLYFAPVLPYRRGDIGDDAMSGVFFRPDTVSLLYVPPTSAQTTVNQAMDMGNELVVDAHVNCGVDIHNALCGFTQGMRVLLYESDGLFDTATVVDVQGEQLRLQHDTPLSSSYNDGAAVIAEVVSHTYYLKADVSTSTFQLMHYDGYQTDLPVLDNVVGLEFEYFGDPQPPTLIPDVASVPERRRTTYGPKPPDVGADDTNDSWSAGENCAFTLVSGTQLPRLSTLPGGPAIVRLSPSMLDDGPWCPDAVHGRRFDADLLRIRKIRIRLRVQAAAASMRGPAGMLFTRGGVFTSAERFVPDQEIRLDISPRNMETARVAP